MHITVIFQINNHAFKMFEFLGVILVAWSCSLITLIWPSVACEYFHATVMLRDTPVICYLSHSEYLSINIILTVTLLYVYKLTILFIDIDITCSTLLGIFYAVVNFSFLNILTTNGRPFTDIMLAAMTSCFSEVPLTNGYSPFLPAWGIILHFLLLREQHWGQHFHRSLKCLQRLQGSLSKYFHAPHFPCLKWMVCKPGHGPHGLLWPVTPHSRSTPLGYI